MVRTDAAAQTLERFLLPSQSQPQAANTPPSPDDSSGSGYGHAKAKVRVQRPRARPPRSGGSAAVAVVVVADVNGAAAGGEIEAMEMDEDAVSEKTNNAAGGVRPKRRRSTPCGLTSVQGMLEDIGKDGDRGLATLLRRYVYVGHIDAKHSILQYETKLYLTDHHALCTALFYQETVRHFGEMDAIALTPPAAIEPLLRLALDDPESDWRPEDGSKEELAKMAADLLVEKGSMLNEYFSLDFVRDNSSSGGDDDFDASLGSSQGSSQGGVAVLRSLPCVLDHYAPQLGALPFFLLRLVTQVDWESERACFDGVAKEIGSFYAELPFDVNGNNATGEGGGGGGGEARASSAAAAVATPQAKAKGGESSASVDASSAAAAKAKGRKEKESAVVHSNFSQPVGSAGHLLRTLVLPACRLALTPPRRFREDNTFREVACVQQLYRIFERC